LSLISIADDEPGGLRAGHTMLLDLLQQVERDEPVLQLGLLGSQRGDSVFDAGYSAWISSMVLVRVIVYVLSFLSFNS
jgi:hypothetical protein